MASWVSGARVITIAALVAASMGCGRAGLNLAEGAAPDSAHVGGAVSRRQSEPKAGGDADAASGASMDAAVGNPGDPADPADPWPLPCGQSVATPRTAPRWLVFSALDEAGTPEGLYASQVALDGVIQTVRLSDPPQSYNLPQWSIDGRYLAIFVAGDGVYLAEFAGDAPTMRLVTRDALFFRWAPGSRQLLGIERADSELLFDPADPADPAVEVLSYTSEYRPLWSPSGRLFLARLGQQPHAAVYIVDVDDGFDSAILAELDDYAAASFSPDERYVAVWERGPGTGDVMQVLRVSDGRRVAADVPINGDAAAHKFDWAEQHTLIWQTAREGELRVAVVSDEGIGDSAVLAATPSTWTLSSNRRCIAHGCGRFGEYATCVVQLEDGQPTTRARFDSGFVNRVHWTRDGARVAIEASGDELFVIALEAVVAEQTPVSLGTDGVLTQPVGWSADGAWFAYFHRQQDQPFVSTYRLWSVDSETEIEFIAQADREHSSASGAWAPGMLAFAADISSSPGMRKTIRWIDGGELSAPVSIEPHLALTGSTWWQPAPPAQD